ncbi:MAG: YSC84-related protein [Pseudomonadota bacterium]
MRNAGLKIRRPFLMLMLLCAIVLTGCAASSPSNDVLIADSRAAIVRFAETDPGLNDWVNHAHGYAVFPNIGKGGLGIGGSFGRGIVFERGEPIGRTQVTQGTVGWQIGIQSYAQVIFFQDEAALTTFQRENFEFSAQATAVAATAGAAATTSYERGVAVFIDVRGGLMAEATVGGQKFEYEAL